MTNAQIIALATPTPGLCFDRLCADQKVRTVRVLTVGKVQVSYTIGGSSAFRCSVSRFMENYVQDLPEAQKVAIFGPLVAAAAAQAAQAAPVLADNAATQIVAAAAEIFEKGWQQVVAHDQRLYQGYEQLKAAYETAVAASWAAGDFRRVAELEKNHYCAQFLPFYTGRTDATYDNTDRHEYAAHKQALARVIRMEQTGFAAFMENERRDYFERVSAHLRLALEKKRVHTFPRARLITIKGSPKRFTVAAYVDSRRLVTECISAGGYNIQCFHYRYLVKF